MKYVLYLAASNGDLCTAVQQDRGPRPSSVKDDLRRQGHSEKKKPYQVRRGGVLR